MDIKSMTELMQMTMLKKIASDSSADSLTGSSSNADMFKMMLDVLIENAGNASNSAQAEDNGLAQLMALQNSITGNTNTFQGYGEENSTDLGQINSVNQATETQNSATTSTSPTSRVDIEQAIQAASKKYGVDEDFIRAMIKQESGFRPGAVSNAGAMGLMQLMPKTADSLGVQNPFNAMENVDGGTKYIKRLMDSFGGSKELALSAYNGGIGRMNRRGVDTVNEISNMPKETKNYVDKVMKAYESYKK